MDWDSWPEHTMDPQGTIPFIACGPGGNVGLSPAPSSQGPPSPKEVVPKVTPLTVPKFHYKTKVQPLFFLSHAPFAGRRWTPRDLRINFPEQVFV